MTPRWLRKSPRPKGFPPPSLLGLSAGIGGLLLVAFFALAGQDSQAKLTAPGPLSKAHSSLEGEANCRKCHADGKKIDADRCLACHKPVSARIAAKKGVHREVSGDCEACHQEHQGADVDIRPLDPKDFDHAAETGFAFEGKHAGLAKNCPACHKGRSYMANQRDCGSCHAEPHQGAMPQKCEACHTPAGWNSVSRGFHKAGIFPLEGRHLEVPCASCHLNGVYKGTPIRCYDCHWIRRQDDRYRTALGTDCENCHRPVSWTAVSWDHGARTGMPLNAAHRNLSCDNCHKNGNFSQATFDCYSCHREDYEETEEPNHAQAGFPTTCELCHLPSHTSWDQASFDHNSIFPRQGVHATLQCAACHKNGVYAGTPRECYGCHRTDYEQTRDPNHVAAGYPTTCELCHQASDSSWDQANSNHSAFFALEGIHATLDCAACHKNGVYAGTPRECYGCHRTNYEQTRDPNHVAAGYPTTCELCHQASDSSWDQADSNHNTFFALQGVHATLDCAACHISGVYAGTSRECYGCHRANYEQTRDPNHVAAGFPTTCDSCHRASDTSWNQARFDHTWFPITSGRHAGNDCSACHTDANNFKVFSCLTCHSRGSTDGNHSGVSGYRYDSAACYSCHPQGRAD